jgi:prephenate dehydrogenase
VVQATPEEHDREAAVVQGLTHLIAKALVRMEPLPSQMTTASYELLMQATEMVRHDADGVFTAIEQANPFAGEVRARFFAIAEDLRGELESSTVQIDRAS